MKITAISDTHGYHGHLSLAGGDILIHSGDFTRSGRIIDAVDFLEWFAFQNYIYKILICGNHELDWDKPMFSGNKLFSDYEKEGVVYLKDKEVIIEGLKIYGSPWQPEFCNWAFNLTSKQLKKKWELIPADTDILITHCPPHGIGDLTTRGLMVGCLELKKALDRVHPLYHIFGHIHEAYGLYQSNYTMFVNASSLDENYDPTKIRKPLIVEV